MNTDDDRKRKTEEEEEYDDDDDDEQEIKRGKQELQKKKTLFIQRLRRRFIFPSFNPGFSPLGIMPLAILTMRLDAIRECRCSHLAEVMQYLTCRFVYYAAVLDKQLPDCTLVARETTCVVSNISELLMRCAISRDVNTFGKIFGAKRDKVTGEWRNLHNAEVHTLYSSPDIIGNIKSRHLKWAGYVARMVESRNAYRGGNETFREAEVKMGG
ncbi:hypothetical protein ANN_23841 [Periplaneta americana]|uniref:Uncharacterized protein n=1 Tax=Periplaneta americana TaxID=6978 RepID=A0ABQ8SMN4_PERAM|nr:hypothetical protein ANN_23841 [Periplaneta americana]